MSERGSELMTRARWQLDAMTEFFGALDEADLRKPCPGADAEYTVGAVGAHAAEIPHYLGQFLHANGYAPQSSATENGRDHGHAPPEALPHLPDLLARLNSGVAPIGLLADLTDAQLDSVPPAGSGRFSDGRRSLGGVIDAVIVHQAGLLRMLKRAVASGTPLLRRDADAPRPPADRPTTTTDGGDAGDTHAHDLPHARQHDSEKYMHTHIGHEHSTPARNHDGDSHDEDAAAHSRHRPSLHHVSHIRARERPRGFLSKKRAGILVPGGAAFAIVHIAGGGTLVHVVLPLLVGIALWQWAGGIVVGLLIVGMALYLGMRRRLAASDTEGA